MLDQSFSAHNFRRILDIENRKGLYLEGKYFPDAAELSVQLKASAGALRELRRQLNRHPSQTLRDQLAIAKAYHEELRDRKERVLAKHLEAISLATTNRGFSVGLSEGPTIRGRTTYVSNGTPEAFFALKQIQYNIKQLYQVRQANRHHILSQLREVLRDRIPKIVIRADVANFYESVRRDKLLKHMAESALLTPVSLRIVKQILWNYGDLSGKAAGLPRGLGLSAILSEVYVRHLDQSIRELDGLIYYNRYVDDVVIVLQDMSSDALSSLRRRIVRLLRLHGLRANTAKTTVARVPARARGSLTYLGYEIEYGNGQVQFTLPRTTQDRFKFRIRRSFDAYNRESKSNDRKARQMLLRRLRYLTGNTRLSNNKRKAAVGVYFSYRLLTDSRSFEPVDQYLRNLVSNVKCARLKNRLADFSFVAGFETRAFHHFSPRKLSEIVRVWKYGT